MLWLWRRPVAAAPIRPLDWEPPYVLGMAQEKAKRQKTNKQKKKSVESRRKSKEVALYGRDSQDHSFTELFFLSFFVVVAISWAAPAAYGGSQARG